MRLIRHLPTLAAILAVAVAAPAAHAQSTTSVPAQKAAASVDRYFAGATLKATPTINCIDTSDTATTTGYATATATVTGTATSLTVSFAATTTLGPTLANQWVALPMAPQTAAGGLGIATLSTTATGVFVAPISGFRQVCAYLSAYSSGSVAINWNISDKPRSDLTPDAMRVPFNCILDASTSTSQTNFTAAAGFASACTSVTGMRFYITDVNVSSSGIATTSNYPQISYSTTLTTTCASSPIVVWQAQGLALTPVIETMKTPIITPQSVDLCFLDAAAGTHLAQIQGFLAP